MRKINLYIFIILILAITIPKNTLAALRISELDAIDLGTWVVGSSKSGNDNICAHNTLSADYDLTATDNSTITSSGFYLETSGSTYELPYSITWTEVTNSNQTTVLTDGSLENMSGADLVDDCPDGVTSNIQIDITNAQMMAARAGTYTVEIKLEVSD